MSKTIMPPTREVEKLVNIHDQLIKNFIAARNPNIGYYESHVESNLMMILIIRYIDSISLLAKQDLIFFPSAMILSRSAFETAVKVCWMLMPVDPWENEARWLRVANQEELFYYNYFEKSQEDNRNKNTSLVIQRNRVKEFYDEVSKRLEDKFPGKYDYKKRLPNIRKMMGNIGIGNLYDLYKISSQYTHGSMIATQNFKKGYGHSMEIREFIKPQNWAVCFQLTLMALLNSGNVFLSRTGGDIKEFCPPDFKIKIDTALHELAS